MNRQLVFGSVCVAAVFSSLPGPRAFAAEDGDPRNRLWFTPRFGFNITAEFKNQTIGSNPGDATTPGINRYYDNGAVLVDSSDNAGGLTMNWGFDRAGQVNNGMLSLSSSASPADGYSTRIGGDPQFGFEAGYGRVLTRIESWPHGGLAIGLGGSLNYTRVDLKGSGQVSGSVFSIMDKYDLSGIGYPATAPGHENDPGYRPPWPLSPGQPTDPNFVSAPMIPDVPSSRVGAIVPATSVVQTELQGDLFGIKLGPFFDIPLATGFSIQINGGLAVVYSSSDFSWTENTIAGPAALRGSASGSGSDWLLGCYVGAQANFELGKRWNLFLGGEYQNVGSTTMQGGNKDVKLDLGSSFFMNLGVTYSF